ncbi:MAG: ABATE domain-containing protein [Candidatus Sulfomarinibacteraceae bacterium]
MMNDSQTFSFDAGALCLDFANTCGDRPLCSEEKLGTVKDLVDWGAAAGLVSTEETDRFLATGGGDEAVREAVALREAIYSVCSSLARGGVPHRRDLAMINSTLRAALPNLELGVRGSGCCWRWSDASTASDRIIWPVARSAADLLTSDTVELLRECAGEGCSWLFLDRSRNHRRKWCSMSSCGNRAKARRHYARTRSKR